MILLFIRSRQKRNRNKEKLGEKEEKEIRERNKRNISAKREAETHCYHNRGFCLLVGMEIEVEE